MPNVAKDPIAAAERRQARHRRLAAHAAHAQQTIGAKALLNEHETSHVTGRAVSTLQKERVIGGGIPFVKIGRQVRYRREDVDTFLASLTPRRSTSEARPDAQHEAA